MKVMRLAPFGIESFQAFTDRGVGQTLPADFDVEKIKFDLTAKLANLIGNGLRAANEEIEGWAA